jgi:hypothetical protein
VLPGIHRYFASLGLPAFDLRALIERIGELAHKGERRAQPDGGSVVSWRDPSGAALSLFLDRDGSILGVLPFFTGSRRSRALLRAIERDPDFDFYDRVQLTVVDHRNEPRLDLHVPAADLGPVRERLQVGSPTNLALTALADAWRCVEPGDVSWLPSITDATGIMPFPTEEGPSPWRVGLRAQILRVDEPLNRHSRVAFQHARVRVRDTELDVLVPEADGRDPVQPLVAGRILEGTFMVVATLDPSRLDATMAGARR